MDVVCICVFFFKQKTAYELRISDWSSDVCSSDLVWHPLPQRTGVQLHHRNTTQHEQQQPPSSYRRERHATGVDGKLPRELLALIQSKYQDPALGNRI